FIQGPPRCGKGTFTEVLLALVEKPLATEVKFAAFTRDRNNDPNNFDLAVLRPARTIFASESDQKQKINSVEIKSLTGGNEIMCCFKNKDHFAYRPRFKIWLSSNYEINGDPDDDALWSRLRLLHFPYSKLGREDLMLKEQLKSPAQLSGVLAWAVEGAKRWYAGRTQRMATPRRVYARVERIRSLYDHIGQWIAERIEAVTSTE